MSTMWGLLGPEVLPNARRNRTLGLGASVRAFNDLAVPGLGGVWYGKQLLLATLGVAVAERARQKGMKVANIEAANAIEALACWLAYKNNDWIADARLRGRIKLHGHADFSFNSARKRNFYVTQPMRMATVQALPALGFVEADGTRFNAFKCSVAGQQFIDKVTEGYSPSNRKVLDHLTKWVTEKGIPIDSTALRAALSPLEQLAESAVPWLSERLLQGGSESTEAKARRSDALNWVEALRADSRITPSWETQPQHIAEHHWRDLRAGALFFETRSAATGLLDAAESHIGQSSGARSLSLRGKLPETLARSMDSLRSAAKEFLEFGHSDEDAKRFCGECSADDPKNVLKCLVLRDERVLRMVGEDIKPGPAFKGVALPQRIGDDDDEDQETPITDKKAPLPPGISRRMTNLFLLNLDMHGELNAWLQPQTQGVKT